MGTPQRMAPMISFLACLVLGLAAPVEAGFLDSLKSLLAPAPGGEGGAAGPSLGDVSQGLLEALRVGAERAVGRASAAGGFLDNPAIHIPLPPAVQKVGGALRAVGLGAK